MNWPPDSEHLFDATDPHGGEPAARAARLDRIKEQIESGRYDVPAADVADAIVAFYARSSGSTEPATESDCAED